jgi:hypothetical protein
MSSAKLEKTVDPCMHNTLPSQENGRQKDLTHRWPTFYACSPRICGLIAMIIGGNAPSPQAAEKDLGYPAKGPIGLYDDRQKDLSCPVPDTQKDLTLEKKVLLAG